MGGPFGGKAPGGVTVEKKGKSGCDLGESGEVLAGEGGAELPRFSGLSPVSWTLPEWAVLPPGREVYGRSAGSEAAEAVL